MAENRSPSDSIFAPCQLLFRLGRSSGSYLYSNLRGDKGADGARLMGSNSVLYSSLSQGQSKAIYE